STSQFNGPLDDFSPYIPVIFSHAGADNRLLESVMQQYQVDGIIMAGTGAGRCSPSEETPLLQAKQDNIPVVMASRLASGRVLPIEYYDAFNLITADDLPPQKARILLLLALKHKLNHDDIKQAFTIY